MPKKSETSSVETEKGFGTGLRGKLEARRPDQPESPESELSAVDAAADEQEAAPTETEQLWAELEEALAREDELKQTLAERAEAFEQSAELERTLAARAKALEERERKLAAQLQSVQEEAARVESESAAAHGSALAHLRQRADEHAEQVWKVFQEALTATRPDGQPDFRTRLTAAATLLEETYGTAVQELSPGEQVEAARDELAGLRAARTAGNKR